MDLTSAVPASPNGSDPRSALARLPQRRWCAGAREDPLTGLLAFPDFHRTLPASLVAALEGGALVALAIGDVDGLKEHVESSNYTDPASYGHLAGNAVMARLGQAACTWFREQPWTAGCMATFGGDEVIVAVREDDPARFLAAVRDLRDRLRLSLPVTVSFAVTVVAPGDLPADRADPHWADRFTDTLFATVDRCLFIHKAARRDAQLPGGIVAVTAPGPSMPSAADGLFPLPTRHGESLHAIAVPIQVGGQTVLLLPCSGPEGMRGYRMRVALGYQRPATEVVLSVGGQAVIAAPPGGTDSPVAIILSTARGSSPHRVPPDLHAALTGADLDWSALPTPEQDQLLHLIRESADSTIRSARIDAALIAVSARMRNRM